MHYCHYYFLNFQVQLFWAHSCTDLIFVVLFFLIECTQLVAIECAKATLMFLYYEASNGGLKPWVEVPQESTHVLKLNQESSSIQDSNPDISKLMNISYLPPQNQRSLGLHFQEFLQWF